MSIQFVRKLRLWSIWPPTIRIVLLFLHQFHYLMIISPTNAFLALTVDLICLNISAAINGIDVSPCNPHFDTVLSEEASFSDKCWALEDGLHCVAGYILSPEHVDGCVSTAIATAASYPEVLPEIIETIGKDSSSLSLNVTNCPGFADPMCFDVPMMIYQTTLYPTCTPYFDSLESQNGNASAQCSSLEAGFRCLSHFLVQPIGVEACVNVLMEISTNSQEKVYSGLHSVGIDVTGLTLDTTYCMDEAAALSGFRALSGADNTGSMMGEGQGQGQTPSNTVQSSAVRMFLNAGCYLSMLFMVLHSYLARHCSLH